MFTCSQNEQNDYSHQKTLHKYWVSTDETGEFIQFIELLDRRLKWNTHKNAWKSAVNLMSWIEMNENLWILWQTAFSRNRISFQILIKQI